MRPVNFQKEATKSRETRGPHRTGVLIELQSATLEKAEQWESQPGVGPEPSARVIWVSRMRTIWTTDHPSTEHGGQVAQLPASSLPSSKTHILLTANLE